LPAGGADHRRGGTAGGRWGSRNHAARAERQCLSRRCTWWRRMAPRRSAARARPPARPGRLRYTTSHPRDMGDGLIAAHRDVEQLMPFLHLPVQSGSDRILAAMNRRHTADEYRRTVQKLREARPDLALSSDFIVGYPGESELDFRATLDLVSEIEFAQ